MWWVFVFLWGCSATKRKSQSFIDEPFPVKPEDDIVLEQYWIAGVYETATPKELEQRWIELFEESYVDIRMGAMDSLLQKVPQPAIAMSFAANPQLTAAERCRVHLIAHRYGIHVRESSLPRERPDGEARLMCALRDAVVEKQPKAFLSLLSQEELPITLDFFEELQRSKLQPVSDVFSDAAENAKGEFSYISFLCSWMILEPQRGLPLLKKALLDGTEDDRIEAIEILLGKPQGEPIFKMLASSKSYSGILASLALLSIGQGSIDFAMKYVKKGEYWELRIQALSSMAMWHRENIDDRRAVKIERFLIKLLQSEHRDVLLATIRALGMSGSQKSIKHLKNVKYTDVEIAIERALAIRRLSKYLSDLKE